MTARQMEQGTQTERRSGAETTGSELPGQSPSGVSDQPFFWLDQKQMSHVLFNNVSDAVFVADMNTGLILDANHAAIRLMGCERNEIVGRHHTEIHPPEKQDMHRALFQSRRSGESKGVHEGWVLRKDGVRIPVEIAANVLQHGPQRIIISFFRDVSTQRDMESRISKMNERLEEMVKVRTENLKFVNSELEAFMQSVSHDLRAPVQVMASYTDVLVDEYGKTFNEEGRRNLRYVREAAWKLKDMLKELLDLVRSSKETPRKTNVDLTRVGRSLADSYVLRYPDRIVSCAVAEGMTAECDERMALQLIGALMDNAWKFTAKTGETKIAFGVNRGVAEDVFFVRDNGVGFDMKYADKLFTPFKRLHSDGDLRVPFS